MVTAHNLLPVLTPPPQSWNGTFHFSLMCTVIFPQNVFSQFYHRGSNQLMLWGALLGKSADRASVLCIILLFCDLTLM